jgi:hypothetical protein
MTVYAYREVSVSRQLGRLGLSMKEKILAQLLRGKRHPGKRWLKLPSDCGFSGGSFPPYAFATSRTD